MEKLKTLKDLPWYQDDINKPVVRVNVEELKAEAIKWIKEACTCAYPDACDCWPDKFMEFHNITDEDLK